MQARHIHLRDAIQVVSGAPTSDQFMVADGTASFRGERYVDAIEITDTFARITKGAEVRCTPLSNVRAWTPTEQGAKKGQQPRPAA